MSPSVLIPLNPPPLHRFLGGLSNRWNSKVQKFEDGMKFRHNSISNEFESNLLNTILKIETYPNIELNKMLLSETTTEFESFQTKRKSAS